MLVLALALGMVPAMTATTALALEFDDADDIGNINAAKVNNALGIIVGDNGGTTFRPGDTLNRAEAATIITRLLIGADLAEHYEKSTASSHFTDVSSSQWWSGVIMFTYERGIMYGTNASGTRFTPRGTLTIPEFAIMLMRALGKATTNDYRDGNWRADAIVDATKLGLLSGLSGDLTRAATRDIASQMAFNALVYSDASAGSVTKYQVVATVSTVPAIIALQGTNYDTFQAAMSAAITAGGTYSGASANFTIVEVTDEGTLQSLEGSLANTVHGLRSNRSTDAFERPVTNYTRGTTTVVTITDVPITTYVGPASHSAIRSAFGITNDTTNRPVYVDGEPDGTTPNLTSALTGDLSQGGHGVQVELYRAAGGISARIVVINTYVGEVAVSTVGTRSIGVGGGLSGQGFTGYTTTAYANNNIITFEYSNKTGLANINARVHNISVIEPIPGVAITATTGSFTANATGSGTFVADGETYRLNRYNQIQGTALNTGGSPAPRFDIYRDSNGYVVLTKRSADTAIPSDLLYVLEIGYLVPAVGSNPVFADVIFDDGSTKTIQTNIRANAAGDITAGAPAWTSTIADIDDLKAAFTANPIAFYRANDSDVYTLTIAQGASVHTGTTYLQRTATTGGFVNDQINLTGFTGGGAITGLFVNLNTRFIIPNASGDYTRFTGHRAAPSFEDGEGAVLVVGTRAVAVFVVDGKADTVAGRAPLFIIGLGRATNLWTQPLGDHWRYNVVEAGEPGTLLTDPSLDIATGNIAFATGTTVTSGLVTALTNKSADTAITALTRITSAPAAGTMGLSAGQLNNNGTLAASTPGQYNILNSADVYLIASSGAIEKAEDGIAALDSAVGRYAAVVLNSSGDVTTVYLFNYNNPDTYAVAITGFVLTGLADGGTGTVPTISVTTAAGIYTGTVTVGGSGMTGGDDDEWAEGDTIVYTVTLAAATNFAFGTGTPTITVTGANTGDLAVGGVTRVNNTTIRFTLTFTIPA